MKILASVASLLFSSSLLAATFEGFEAIDTRIERRLIRPGSSFKLSQREIGSPLNELLGAYPRGGELGSPFLNGQPNALNVLLYYGMMRNFSIQVAMTCNNPRNAPSVFQDDFFALIWEACGFPLTGRLSEHYLDRLGEKLLAFDLPEEEFLAWKRFLLSTQSQVIGKEFLKAAVHSAYMNPYFLMRP